LLEEHAWYEDPTLGRFISPDSLVPGAGALTAVLHDAVAQGGEGYTLHQHNSTSMPYLSP